MIDKMISELKTNTSQMSSETLYLKRSSLVRRQGLKPRVWNTKVRKYISIISSPKGDAKPSIDCGPIAQLILRSSLVVGSPTHLKHMQPSNWIMTSPQGSENTKNIWVATTQRCIKSGRVVLRTFGSPSRISQALGPWSKIDQFSTCELTLPSTPPSKFQKRRFNTSRGRSLRNVSWEESVGEV